MYRHLLSRVPVKLSAAVACSLIVYKNFQDVNMKGPLLAKGVNCSRKYYPVSAEYPEISKNRNIMARNLTKSLYAKLRDAYTPNGFTIDDAIQTGVDNIGQFSFTGIVAGDEQSYETFKELFDKIIAERHNGYKADQKHPTHLDASKLENIVFDSNYVQSVRIRAIRNLRGYCLPPFCTRGERRDVESLIVKALYNLNDSYKGTYYSIKDLSPEEEKILEANNVFMDRPYYPSETSANLPRDWPDARGIWVNQDKTLVAHLNRKDHMLLSVISNENDFKAVFSKFVDYIKEVESQLNKEKWEIMHNEHLGYITTDPKNLGTAMKFSVRIKLPKLSKDGRLSTLLKLNNLTQSYRLVSETQKVNEVDEQLDSLESVLELTSTISLGKSEVEIAQMFADSVNRLIETEKMLEAGKDLNESLYRN